ncbi:hypothetical protein [Nonomuraea sp. NPDC050202]|uniref:hypothetical protein n=1 Tax=Nonomuraea sp. NPDC050202 TaxID=3155035 RepID=UPI0034064F5D
MRVIDCGSGVGGDYSECQNVPMSPSTARSGPKPAWKLLAYTCDLPPHRHAGPRHAAEPVVGQRLGGEPGPQHDAVGAGVQNIKI